MSSFKHIVERAERDHDLVSLLGVQKHQVRDWKLRDSIPPERWQAFATHGLATLEELARAAAGRAQ
jgi:hypothetical protein